ncbi:hypothetical protein MGMO_201c00080 [Methyloglobulus morosus KoM1]|uniref:Uncharacterized protein n=1 Tax=Methyloglobulus morosus KoM1 TaxID=1116472 RepID=V5BNU4_9GAMM|nr:hypothetical protein MGMO_201c00080 [Methyloglobulus morosus KoM1]
MILSIKYSPLWGTRPKSALNKITLLVLLFGVATWEHKHKN